MFQTEAGPQTIPAQVLPTLPIPFKNHHLQSTYAKMNTHPAVSRGLTAIQSRKAVYTRGVRPRPLMPLKLLMLQLMPPCGQTSTGPGQQYLPHTRPHRTPRNGMIRPDLHRTTGRAQPSAGGACLPHRTSNYIAPCSTGPQLVSTAPGWPGQPMSTSLCCLLAADALAAWTPIACRGRRQPSSSHRSSHPFATTS